jgi:hypothetical protein
MGAVASRLIMRIFTFQKLHSGFYHRKKEKPPVFNQEAFSNKLVGLVNLTFVRLFEPSLELEGHEP